MKKPHIDSTSFGSITIDGETFDHDIVIRLSGEIVKRKKKLSKLIFGTSHTVSLDEAKFIYEKGASTVIIGSGQSGMLTLSEEAKRYFSKKDCKIDQAPTPKAIQHWNESKANTVAVFHLTC